ncbi:ferritin-like domain-containing protein [Nannocystaceae bacterium ST9]
MKDTFALRRRLLRALDGIPLALLGAASLACVDAQRELEQQRLEAAKQREQAAREAEAAALAVRAEDEKRAADEIARQQKLDAEAKAAADAKAAEDVKLELEAKLANPNTPEGASGVPHFSCPSGEWCGTKAIAKRYAGEKIPEHPAALGCPGNLEPHDRGPNDPLAPLDDSLPPANMGYAYLDPDATAAKREQGDAGLCCYDWGSLCGGGRPLLVQGQAEFAALDRVDLPARFEGLDPRIGRGWLDDARMEHASIASFLRAEAELAALDAPLALREACLRAAQDERRHARDCFAIAAAYGQPFLPRELPHAEPRPASLERLAIDTLIEGGIGETIAALMARRAVRALASTSELRPVLERIAADELEHAALAWQTIAWAIDRGGASVLAALRAAAERARPDFDRPHAEQDTEQDAEQLASHGRLDARAKAQAIRDAWCELIDPVLSALAQRSWPSIATNCASASTTLKIPIN